MLPHLWFPSSQEAESTCPVPDPGVVCSAWEGSSRCRAHLHGECSTGCSHVLPSWNMSKVFLDQPKFLLSEQIQGEKYTKKFESICIVKLITPAQSQQFKCISWWTLAFLSHVYWVPKANTLQYSAPTDFVVVIPARQAKRVSVISIRASLSLRKIVGTNTYLALRKANARPVHILFFPSFFASFQPLKAQVANWSSAGTVGQGTARSCIPCNHTSVPAPSEGRQPPLLVKGYLQLQLTYGCSSMRTKFPNPMGVHLTSTDWLLCI